MSFNIREMVSKVKIEGKDGKRLAQMLLRAEDNRKKMVKRYVPTKTPNRM